MKKFVVIFLVSFVTTSLLAQDSTRSVSPTYRSKKDKRTSKKDRINNMLRMEEEGDLIFNKHSIFGIKLATDGYGISFEKGKYISTKKTRILQFELNEKKDKKEHKVTAAGYNGYNFNTVIVGKLNNFYQFKVSMGEERLIGGKGNKNGVSVSGLYTAGLSLGIVKPYIVDVIDQNGGEFRSSYPTIFDSSYVEQGSSGFTTGWKQATFKPGLNAKVAMRFDYGRLNQTITAIEAGLTGEFYFSKIPQMYAVAQKQFFFNAYLSIMFGRRK